MKCSNASLNKLLPIAYVERTASTLLKMNSFLIDPASLIKNPEAPDYGQSLYVVPVDVSEAFDSVPQIALLLRPQSYDFVGPILKVLRSFLASRKTTVKLGHGPSQPVRVNAEVP